MADLSSLRSMTPEDIRSIRLPDCAREIAQELLARPDRPTFEVHREHLKTLIESAASLLDAFDALSKEREEMRVAVAKLIGRLDLDGYISADRMDDALRISGFAVETDVGDAIRDAMETAKLAARRDDRGFLEFLDTESSTETTVK